MVNNKSQNLKTTTVVISLCVTDSYGSTRVIASGECCKRVSTRAMTPLELRLETDSQHL